MRSVKIFGILNITPDSFSDGGNFIDVQKALDHAQSLIDDGADFIDVGAEATNPSAKSIHQQEEWARLAEVLPKLVQHFPGKISLDTRNYQTARNGLGIGVSVINDVSGFRDPHMISLAAEKQPLCIINHFPGNSPHEVHEQSIDSIDRVIAELLEKRTELLNAGVAEELIVLDPGIGFGKSMELNRQLLHFAEFVPDLAVMIGHSRKRFLGENRMKTEPNLAAATTAFQAGTQYLRVHDVAAHKQHLKNLKK